MSTEGNQETTQQKMEIPFFRYPHVFGQQRDEILAAMTKVMERGSFILQDELKQFEQQIAVFSGAKYAIGMANGTDTLFLALKAAGVGSGDEVILASHTYIATAAAVHFAGGTPVLVECGPDHIIDAAAVAAAVTPRTKVIMPTQLNGRTADMDALQTIARKHGLLIIEDAAQALGSKFKGQCAGTFGFAGSISLYPAKVLGCFGDGGLLFSNDAATNAKLKQLRDHGRNDDGLVVRWGMNSRLDNLQAAVLLTKLKIYPQEMERRRQLARLYRAGLEDLEDMVLPPGPDNDPNHFDIYQNYEVEAGRRDALRAHLAEKGVRSIIQWAGTPVHQFKDLGLPKFNLPATDRLFQRCLLLPMNTSLTDAEIGYICETIRQFYGRT
jgi:dTDP-4-amino-4,6-dideoxygalactose transaminase